MMIANEGQVALEVVEEEESGKNQKDGASKSNGILKSQVEPFDYDEADFRSRDI